MTGSAKQLEFTADGDELGRRVEASWRRAARRDVMWQILLPFAVGIPLMLGWELYARSLNNPFVPGPTDVVAAIPNVLGGELVGAFVVTNVAMLRGYVVAAGAGILLGFVMGRYRLADAITGPYLDLAMVTPMIVLMPIVLMALGLNAVALSVVVFLFALPYIAVPCRAGVRAVPAESVDMARSFGARELQLWREVLLPGSLPAVLTGLRLGFGMAVTGIIATELTLLAVGLGRVIVGYQSKFQTDNTFAVTLLIMLECIVVMGGLRLFELRQQYRRLS